VLIVIGLNDLKTVRIKMPADLTKPFKESCCDGGECSVNEMSCQPCGCDKGANWMCQWHQFEELLKEKENEPTRNPSE
jgi:hypothetical protein